MKQNNLKFENNPYQYTRGVRFRGNTDRFGEEFQKTVKQIQESENTIQNNKTLLAGLADLLLNIHQKLTDLFFHTIEMNETSSREQKSFSVNKVWLKNHHQDIFYLQIKNSSSGQTKDKHLSHKRKIDLPISKLGKYSLKSLKHLHPYLKQWLKDWEKQSLEIKKASHAPMEDLSRRSDIAEHIRELLSRRKLTYISDFLEEVHTLAPDLDTKVEELKSLLKKVEKKLHSAEYIYLSSQSSGVEVAKASLNYYTIDKKPKEYYENNILNIWQKLYGPDWKYQPYITDRETEHKLKKTQDFQPIHSQESNIFFSIIKVETNKQNNIFYKWVKNPYNQSQEVEIFCFKSKQEKEWIKRVCKSCFRNKAKTIEKEWYYKYCSDCEHSFTGLGECTKTKEAQHIFLSLEQTYICMKAFKAEQKSIFYEVMSHIASHIASEKNEHYKVNGQKHVLYDYELPDMKLNFENINKEFSLFKFTEKKINNTHTIDRILAPYKNSDSKVTAEKVYKAFLDLTKKISSANKQETNRRNLQSSSGKRKQQQHPKQKFLKSRNKFNTQTYPGSQNQRKDKNQKKNKGSVQKIKKDRGQFLFGKKCYFSEYGSFGEKYKQVAKERGKCKAQIKGLEKEKQEASQTAYWALIYCDKEAQKQLWLVPKNKRKQAKQFIDSKEKQSHSPEDQPYLCCFESLTMRALHKLCFAEQSSFVKDMPDDLKSLQKEAKEFQTKDEDPEKQKEKQEEKNQKKLKLFKKLLKNNYAKEKLHLKNFDLNDTYKAQTLEGFEKSLEKTCYHITKIFLNEDEKQNFLKKYDVTVLKISSYDLEDRNKNTYQTSVSPNKLHTEWWKKFWHNTSQSNNKIFESLKDNKDKCFRLGEIRLNPEIKIRYRKTDDSLKKYFTARNFPKKFKHRKLKEQFTISFTLSLNAEKKYDDLAFAKPEDILQKIKDFNHKLNNNMNFNTAWKYGIDRGQIELATLCLAKFNPDKDVYKIYTKNGIKTIVKPKFPEEEQAIKCYTLKDYTLEACIGCGALKEEGHKDNCLFFKGRNLKKDEYKKAHLLKNEDWRHIIKNISYFVGEKHIKNTNLFKKENISCLDLTTAKVIKGNIITNGDVMTYLKLKKVVAKRKLYELYHKGNRPQNAKLEWSEWEDGENNNLEKKRPAGVLNLKTSESEETIYWYRKQYEGTPMPGKINKENNKENIEGALNSYLNQLKEQNNKHTPTILEINHLRDSLTANMVGVIYHLQKAYSGFVILEDLARDQINKHFFNSEENIARRLESALYSKFQTMGLVPPHVKDIICLREDFRKKQKNQKNRNKESTNYAQVNSSQIGSIVFVDETGTSKTCPYCEIKQERATTQKVVKDQKVPFTNNKQADKKIKTQKNREKFEQQRFICKGKHSCGFDTYYFKSEEERVDNYTPKVDKSKFRKEFELLKYINDNDKVAAYNIAKKITREEQIGKLELQKNTE